MSASIAPALTIDGRPDIPKRPEREAFAFQCRRGGAVELRYDMPQSAPSCSLCTSTMLQVGPSSLDDEQTHS